MNDTPPDVQKRYHDMLMSVPPVERLKMAGRMFDAAKTFARAGIIAEGVRDEGEIRRRLFLRFYGRDFSPAECEKILAQLDRVTETADD
ncbi:MAG: hypothetical protein R6V58_03440 [Planctomycetota bacterium]